MHSYKIFVVTTIVLILNVFISTHLVAEFVANIYILYIFLLA